MRNTLKIKIMMTSINIIADFIRSQNNLNANTN